MKRNWKKYSMFLILALGLIISATAIWEAFAFTNGYEVTTSSKTHNNTEINSLQYEVRQKKASSSASVKYGTGQWYIFKNEIDANSATVRDWTDTSNAFPVSTTRVKRTDPDSSGVFYDTMRMEASSFVAGLKRICSRDELISGVTLYANRTLIKKDGSGNTTGGPYYNYTDFSKAASWSSGTLNSVLQGYNIPIYVQLTTASFNVRYVELDADGNEIGEMNIPNGFVFGGIKDSKGTAINGSVIYGEALTFGAATYSGKDYVYKGYQWTSKADSSITAGSPSGFTMSNSYAPNGALELTFYFQKKAEVTAPPFVTIPPEEGEEPPVTEPPTPVPPPPTVGIPDPSDVNQSHIRYFSTDAGYWLGKYAKSTSDYVASFGGVEGNGTLSAMTKRTSSYLVGTDAGGNKWYFTADGSNATFVHPHTYNGYVAESADVKYITELVFPSTITYNGTTYTVTHIGGGTDKYAPDDSDYTGAGYLYESYTYSKTYSEDYYSYDQDTGSQYIYRYHYVKMKYGVLGNGEITSNACNNVSYYSGGTITSWAYKNYNNDYYFYNTTLKSITIPSTVKTIDTYAFQYCQALETINGGDGLTNIKFSAFLVDDKPTLSASNTWTDSGYQCYVYYYYNGEYSFSSPTSVMNAWQSASMLAPFMNFPYMKSLQTIASLAFAYHYNLSDVDLPATIATIGEDAFLDCTLDNIRIPNASCSIYDASGSTKYYTTLGSKGRVENPTAIHTVPNSTAMSYGLKYDGYYKLYCGYPVTYYPNGGTPNSPVEIYSALNINYLEGAEPREYANFTQSNSDSYSWYSEDYQYASYLDDDGVLYRIDLLNSRANVVSPGTTFTELVTVGSYNSAHYAWDSAGNLWFSGQYSMQSLDDEDDWYSRYSSMYDWRKVTLPAGAVDVRLDTWGVFVLDSSGYVWTVNPGSGSSRKINGNGDILFKKAYVCTYDGDTDYGNDGMLIGITTEGKFVYVYEDYYGFDIDPYWSYNLTADNFKENTYMTNALNGYNITDIQKTRAGRYIFFADTGEMVLFDGSWVYSSNYNTVTGYNITDMRYLGSYSNGGTFEVFEMKDASGVTYLGTIYGQSTPYCHMRSLGTGITIKKAFTYYPRYGNSWATDDWNDTTTTSGYITVWTSDGYLTRYNTSSYASGAVKYASVKFKEIAYNYNNLYGLAEDGTLWSAGNNLYGQLGTSSSYDYEYPNSNDAMYLHSTGSRTYTDIYFSSSHWVIALGTDGNVYYAGEKPTTTYGGSYSDQKKYAFTALGSDYSWPASSTGTARRYIKGYDYDTEIATNLFAAPSGKQFKNWNTASGGTGTIYQPGDKVNLSAALTLYAQWETKPEQKKYVYFHANGGNGYMEPLVLAYSSTSATLPDCTFTRNNYKLKSPCWNTIADGTGTSYANGATITLTQNATHLYAQWYQDSTTVIKYNLVYMKYPYGTTNNTAWKSKTLTYEAQETIEGAPTSPSGTFTVTYSLNKASSMSTTPTMDTLTAANTTTTASAFEYWEMYRVIEGKLTSVHNRYSPNDVVKGLSQVTGDTIYMYPVQSAANASVLLPMADCDGYVFKGWSETEAGNEKIYPVYGEESEEVSTFTPVKNTTLYAVWEPETYDITLDGQSATTHTQTSVTMTFDAMCPSVTVPSRTRYIFMGYFTGTNGAGTQYYDKDGNGLLKWQISNGSVTTLYAHWVPDKAVSYDANGGTGSMDTSWVDSDKDYLDLPANAFTAPTGYHFAYWCQTAAGCTGESASGHKHWADKGRVTGITGRITLYAQWAPNNYTVTLNYNGGTKGSGDTSPYTVTYNTGSYYDISWGLPTRTGYTFNGFYTAASGGTQIYTAAGVCANDGTYWKSNKWVYTGNVTLYAQWSANTYTVTLDPDGGQPTPAPTVKPTYDANMPAVNVPTRKYTVTFNANTGTCATTSLTSTYIFGGYFSGKNGTGTQYYKADGTSARTWNIAQNTTLYAKWTSVAITLPTATKTGYTFNGWYTAASGGTLVDVAGKSYTPSADITLYAHWTANSYTVALEPEGGTPTPAPTVIPTYDDNMPAVTVPTRKYTVTFNANTGTCATTSLVSEYTFGGYFTGKNGTGTQYYKADGTSARTWNIAQNTTLYAKWTSKAVTLPTPTKTGYTFQGWYTAASGGTKIGAAGDAYTPTADITLYAQWKAKEYDVILNDRGATSINHTEKVHVIFDKKGEDIIPPKKTGYTFRGYYTGIRGSGTQYYDEMGIGIKEWKEENVSELFAYWQQNPVIVPEEEDREEPTPVPETEFEGNLGRNDAKGLLYADDYDAATGALTDLQPYLAYDTYASEGAIPGTEKLSFRAKMGTWILHYKLHRNAGIDYVRFYVTVPYRIQYERFEDEELVISPQQTKTYTFLVPKAWSYWEIKESGMYYADKLTLINPAMKNSQMEICVKNDGSNPVTAPNYDVRQYGDKTTHVFWEEYDGDKYPVLRVSFTEEQYIISDVPDALPEIDNFLRVMCLNAAWKDTRQARVRSDRFILDEHIILSDEFGNNGNGAALDEEAAKLFFDSGKIEETSYSQTYLSGIELDEFKPNGTYETLAEITYIGDTSNVDARESVTIELTDINDIRIHTPVVCRGLITDGMEKLQSEYVLTLKDALNFFTLSVSNAGVHRMSFGYGEKDFSTALSGKSNLAGQNRNHLNQVQFPFDVYVDVGNDSKTLDGKCDPEGDYLLASGTWFTLGTGSRQFYVPVTMKNGEYPIKFRSVAVNCPIGENGQYIFGEEEHRANLSPSCYVAADVIPVAVKSYLRDFRITSVDEPPAAEVLQGGCQALTLKKGYGFKYELLAQGEFYGENSKISIIPSYFWESEDGTERQEVKLYHLGEFPEDKGRVCSSWEGEPVLLRHENYDVILQQFIGNGFVPADILCVAKEFPLEEYAKKNTFTGREEFFLRDGYLMIHFDISVYSNEGETYVFDKWQDTELYTDAKREGWNYIPGDVIRYDLSKSITADYEIGGSE